MCIMKAKHEKKMDSARDLGYLTKVVVIILHPNWLLFDTVRNFGLQLASTIM